MSHADITLRLPLPDEATQDDAQALGQLIERIALDHSGEELHVKPRGKLLRVELVTGNKLGTAGARELLENPALREVTEDERAFTRKHARDWAAKHYQDPDVGDEYASWYMAEFLCNSQLFEHLPSHPNVVMAFEEARR